MNTNFVNVFTLIFPFYVTLYFYFTALKLFGILYSIYFTAVVISYISS